MATHLIFDLQGTPHLATETPDGFLTQSGIFANSNVRFACPVAELEKRVTRFGEGDKVYDIQLKESGVLVASKDYEHPLSAFGYDYTFEGVDNFLSTEPTIVHLSEAQRLGLIPRTDDTETTD